MIRLTPKAMPLNKYDDDDDDGDDDDDDDDIH